MPILNYKHSINNMQAFQYSAFNMNIVSEVNFSYFSTQVVPNIFEPFKYSFNEFDLSLKDDSSYFTEPKQPSVQVKTTKQKKKTIKTPSKPRTEIIEPSYIEYKRKRSK